MGVLEFKPTVANQNQPVPTQGSVGTNLATKRDPELFRLLSGEEVIAVVASENKESVSLKNPLRIVMIPGGSQQAQPQIGMMPLTNFSDDEVFAIDWNFVVFRAKPISNLANEYTRATSKLITPAVPGLIMPK